MTDLIFASDNQAGVSPEIMEALLRCDQGTAPAYGDDVYTGQLDAAFSEVFAHEAFVFSTATGTAANALGLSVVTPPFGETVCHEAAHILVTEGGAPEFYAGGSRLVGLPGEHGKISADHLKAFLDERTRPSRHHLASSSLSLTQATESGTIYSLAELRALSDIAHERGLRVQMDGARFSNALVALDATPAAMSWRAGIDVVSLGTTKNGTMNAEAVIVFDSVMARELAYRQKRAGHLTSKMRYVSAQLLAFLRNDLWLRNARIANTAAARVARILGGLPGVRIVHPVETNQIFAEIAAETAGRLAQHDIAFYAWHNRPNLYRLVMSFRDDESKVAGFEAAASAAFAATGG